MDAETRSATLVSLGVLVVFSLGLVAGGAALSVWLDRPLARWERAATLGTLAGTGEERALRSRAYLDPARAEQEMGDYGWAPANVPTPFVGAGPAPGRHAGITIGSDQFRGPQGPEAPKPPGEWRVFLTGGSTAFSSGAPRFEDTIGARLEACLRAKRPGARVHTYANPAWASAHERIAIEHRLSELEPDVVIALSGVNDVHWGLRGRDPMWLRTYWEQSFFEVLDATHRLARRGPLADPTTLQDDPIAVERLAEVLERNVRISAFVLSLVGARYVYALQPNLATARERITPREQELLGRLGEARARYYREAFAAFRARLSGVDELRGSWWDLSDVFATRDEGEEMFLDSYHFGDRGNTFLAGAICALLSPEVDP